MASARSRMEPFAERTVHATKIIPFPTRIMSAPRRQYTTAFLAGSFGLSEAQATSILDEAGEIEPRRPTWPGYSRSPGGSCENPCESNPT